MANAMDPAELEKIFKSFDANGDGQISSSELADVLKQHSVTEQEIQTMMAAIDSDGDGFISYDEFVAFAKDNRPLMKHFL